MENQNRQSGLYSPAFEHDNCGIGAVVSIIIRMKLVI